MIISRQRNRSNHPDLFLNGKKISEVDNHTHLGVTISNTLSWSVHINKAIAKADRRLNIIRRCQKILPRSCKEMLYKTTIRPVLDYGDIIYDACLKSESDAIEKCQRKAALICTGAFRHTSNERLLNELGWERMESRRTIHSHLKNHLFNYYIIQSKFCENSNCDLISETSSHFLLFCPRYGPQRHTMLSEISTIIFPGTNYNTVIAIMPDYLCNILLQGSEDLSLNENKKVFDCVFKFINDSGRFDHNATAVHDESL